MNTIDIDRFLVSALVLHSLKTPENQRTYTKKPYIYIYIYIYTYIQLFPKFCSNCYRRPRNIKVNMSTDMKWMKIVFRSLGANPTKWSNTLKKFVGKAQADELFDHFVWLTLKGLAHAFTTRSIFLRRGMFRFDKDIANITSVDVFIANFK